MYFTKTLLAASVASALLFSGAASAFSGTYSETATTGLQTTELNSATTSPLLAAAIFQAGWTLSTITISETATIDILAGSTLTNSASGGQTFRLVQSTDFFSSASTADVNAALSSFDLVPTAYNTGFVNLAAGATFTVNGGAALVTTANATTGALLPTSLLSLAIGGAGSSISATTITTDAFTGGGGNILNHINTQGEAAYTVTFNYTQDPITHNVPEPASLALLAAGIVGLGFRRNKKA